MSSARDAVLGRVRDALGDARGAEVHVPRDYRRRDEAARDAIVDLFADRVSEYQATVFRADRGEPAEASGNRADTGGGLAATIGGACRERGAKRLAVPADLPGEWRPDGVELVTDDGLSPRALDGLDGALTGCALAIAETGTIVLDGGAAQGRRALTLVPDYHVCVVRAGDVVGQVPQAIEALGDAVRSGRPVTFVSGPSATSDIELIRVEGVHGPRTLHVVIAA